MPLNVSMVEQLAEWCAKSDALADIRSNARSDFFGYDEPGTIKYMAGTGEVNGRERRFLGWFCFGFRLPDSKHPAELAATALLSGLGLTSALKSIQETRYVMAVTTMVRPGKGVYLELEDEEFELDSRLLSQVLHKDDALCAHIIPVGRGRWLACPGWLVWPTRLGPGIRSQLKQFQLDPVKLERFLQQRASATEGKPKIEYPRDKTLEEAVAKMTEAAQAHGYKKLILTPAKWKKLVLSHMMSGDIMGFSKEIMNRLGEIESVENINRWLGLAMNIWNTTPQPDRGGKTAYEMGQQVDD